MATLTVQTIVQAGLGPTYASAASGGDVATNDGKLFLHVKNAHGSVARSVTITAVQTYIADGTALSDRVVSVPAAGERMIGPFTPGGFNNASGQIAISYDDEADVTIAALNLA